MLTKLILKYIQRITEIEEQLQIAESRCNTLKNQLDSMKKNYKKVSPRDTIQPRRKNESYVGSKTQRKRAGLSQPSSSYRQQHQKEIYDDDCPVKSNSSSAMYNEHFKNKALQPLLIRQNSTSIATDHTGAAVKTINNILSGITESVNRLTQYQDQSNDDYMIKCTYVEQPFSNDQGRSCTISRTPFSPRLNKRLYDQQKKVAEIIKESTIHAEKTSAVSIKSKETALEKWSKQITGHFKTRSTARHVDTATSTKPSRLGVSNDDSQSFFKKKKRVIKRLKASSKMSVTRKLSNSDTHSQKCVSKFSTDNLVELYHNVAARSSDSDNSNHGNRVQMDNRQGAGDVSFNTTVPTYHASKVDVINKSENRLMQSPRILAPIEESMTIENSIVRRKYFQQLPKNYQLPTIASKLKRVTKNYLRSFNYFNFRCIPFCAAKSTSPSHNIGINIQQVMSIIKTRQPITGISPTLAHNISLAAEKLQGSPLSAFVSNLSTRIGSGTSACPLIKHQLNYTKLQEMAKAIPEEPYEEENCDVTFMRKDIEPPPPVPPIWSAAPESARCTCISQKGVPFQKVLSKYQIASSEVIPTFYRQENKYHQPPGRQIQSAYYNNSKQRTAAWVSHGVKENSSNISNFIEPCKPINESLDQQQLHGKEKNLKAVLKNLHDEFDSLNTRYEMLSKCDSKTNPDNVKQLEEMENQLNQKEEEINMVMSLYTEVMALKDQVKKLKERTSCETIYTASSPEKKETGATMHLTHLLRQIQNYQNRYQNKA
ncbi:hypothetical protein RN001_014424 [Aquatica leii]|uniref:Uncharacterized protein n=1 Tax=Aquatica leii TaxID=1421715 RepID=A0AAN7NUI7_9COLE|nr:hypothetical protein RN001_014424 [Aquatica leii]